MKTPLRRMLLLLLIAATASFAVAEEGMYPISMIQKLNLKAKGLLIDPSQIYNPNGISLIDAIVMIGGCTGSFVSPDGLVLTNHHCAFGAVQSISSERHDYLTDGFLAKTQADEIPARGYTLRITDSYKDVSGDVLAGLTEGMELAERTKTIDRNIKKIVAETEQQNPGKRAEVAEMFPGKTYVLFVYTYLRDVRLVYVPPRGIGNFGGEIDNWMWPRHTGDFSFMRVYVAPDGSPADYSPENVPFHPKKFLKVQPAGVEEGDFAFILGYPGRTYRHRTSHYLEYEYYYRMPYIANLFDWQISIMEEMGQDDREVAIRLASQIKGRANVMKNYRGKIQGIRRLDLIEKKHQEEAALQQFIDADPARKANYGTVLQEIGDVYKEMTAQAESELILSMLVRSSRLLSNAYTVFRGSQELQKPDLERQSSYMNRNINRLKESLKEGLDDYNESIDKIFLRELLLQASELPKDQRVPAVDALLTTGDDERDIDTFIDEAYSKTVMGDYSEVLKALDRTPEEVGAMNDPFINLARDLAPTYEALRETNQRRQGALTRLYAELVDVTQEFLKTSFIPDANRTLRLTYGTIKGYSPRDATYCSPITTLTGVLEKTTGEEPFDTPQKVIDLAKAKDYGRYKSAKLNDVPVAILYNMDTTGGNSGSPVLNARGELVGVNFDRAWEATINDYTWNERYSRSIAVDIRYVLWVTKKIGGADRLLKEMGVEG